MTTRIIILSLVDLFLFFLSILSQLYGEGINFPFVFLLISLSVTIFYVWTHKEFDLYDNFLIVYQPLKGQSKFNLKQVVQWQEISYPIRGQRRRDLFLLFDSDGKVTISNLDFKDNYESLIQYLKKEHPKIEIITLSALGEIRYNSVHDFLVSDFYQATKVFNSNEERVKKISMDVYLMKVNNATQDELAEKLFEIKTKDLAQHETLSHCKQIANRILDL